MSAFIGYDDIGVWCSNNDRDAFLDWFADHRCVLGDAKWQYCKSEDQRWLGRCINLGECLFPQGDIFEVTATECAAAALEYWPRLGQLLRIIGRITQNEWRFTVDSEEAINWPPNPATHS